MPNQSIHPTSIPLRFIAGGDLRRYTGKNMKSYKLFNFNHSFQKPRTFKFGPFTIEINDVHCENLKLLTKCDGHTLTVDENFKPVFETTTKRKGETVETAIASIEDSDLKDSVITNPAGNMKTIDDLCLILSFLTGRKVYLEADIEDYHSLHYTDPVVSQSFFYHRTDVFEKLPKIKKAGLESQFYNCVTASSNSDLLCFATYSNANLNAIYERWCKQNKLTTYSNKKIIEKLITKAFESTERSIITRAQRKFIELIKLEGIDTDTIDDIVARIRPYADPSAIYKLKAFLKHYELYPEKETDEHKHRLSWLNKVRNQIAHVGDIPTDKKISWEMMCEITCNIAFLVSAIVNYYFGHHLLEIDDYSLKEEREEIRKYFDNGTFRGKRVFDETYDDYMQRVEREWVDQGNVI